MRSSFALLCAIAGALAMVGCSNDDRRESPPPDGGPRLDAGLDARPGDGGRTDTDGGPTDGSGPAGDGGRADGAATGDGGRVDGAAPDAGHADAGFDAGHDAGPADAGFDAGFDAGHDAGHADAGFDAGHDAGAHDAGHDAGSGSCITDPDGTHAVRFEWRGSGSGSTAWVDYELNELPDTSRWRVSSASSSFSYTPTYGDIYLGDGGLILEGSAFIDVELSTAGLSAIRGVTLAIRGRSYDTTTSGSFEWQTFSGTGAAPYGSVANSAPYEWYPADATAAFVPGDDGVLLRIYPGPPSGSLVVHRVEICFDAS